MVMLAVKPGDVKKNEKEKKVYLHRQMDGVCGDPLRVVEDMVYSWPLMWMDGWWWCWLSSLGM